MSGPLRQSLGPCREGQRGRSGDYQKMRHPGLGMKVVNTRVRPQETFC